jgi:hypothetical protein
VFSKMSFAKFSAQGIVQDFLRETNMSVETFSNLQFESPRISRWILQRILDGDRSVDEIREGPKLVRLVRACRAFQKSMPIDPDWSDPRVGLILSRDYKSVQEAPQPFIPESRA